MGISKYSNIMKAYCIDNGIVDYVNDTRKKVYKMNDIEAFSLWFDKIHTHNELDCSMRLLDSKYRKYARAREHIEEIVMNGSAIFLTLTFTDDILKRTSANTRRRYVARFLKEQSDFYVANIDYSPTKQREHYHAVVCNRVDMNAWKKYGFIWCEQVRAHDFCAKRVARYVAKLTSHAFKVNATRLIYSRNCV